MKITLLVAGAALIVPSASLAQTAGPGEKIIVTATRLATPSDQIASSVTVIGADEIAQRQLRSLPDILRDVPGLNLVQSGGEGDQTSSFLRGVNSNHTKILYDGIDLSDPSTPNDVFDLGKLNAADIARVEVLRGPGSSLYGSDAIGGVINVITQGGEGPMKLSGEAEGGSFDSFNQDATLSGAADAFHYRLTLAHQHAGDTPVTPPSLLLPGEKANGDFYDGLSASTKLGYDVTEAFDLGFVGRYSNNLEHITNDGFSLTTFQGFPSPTPSRVDMLNYDARATAHLALEGTDQTLGLSYGSAITSDNDPDNGYSLNAGTRIKLDWQGHAKLIEGEILVLGAETARDAIHQPLSAGITINAGYGELQSSLGDFSNSVSLRYDDNSRFGNKLTWRIAPGYRIAATGTRLRATAGSGFKAPSLEDLFGPFGHNPNLKPETSTGYDAGFDQDLPDGFSLGATWYRNDIRNLIDIGGPPAFAPVNIGRARTEGAEAYLAWVPIQTLTLRADYTFTEARDLIAGTALLRRPKHKLSLNALWRPADAWTVDASLLTVSAWADIGRESFLVLRQGGYTTADIALNYAVNENLTLFGRVSNLADTGYQNPNGFLAPGRAFYAGVKASLE